MVLKVFYRCLGQNELKNRFFSKKNLNLDFSTTMVAEI
jgi:hypothetical protein